MQRLQLVRVIVIKLEISFIHILKDKIVNFILGIIASLVANLFTYGFNLEKRNRSKRVFIKKSKKFHEEISPYLLNKVIPNYSKGLSRRLERIEVYGETYCLPFISLSNKKDIKLHGLIDEKRLPVRNKKLIYWLKNELGKRVENNPTFTLNSIISDGSISVGVSDYESTLSTADIHYFNLIRYFPISKKYFLLFSYRNNLHTKKWLSSLNKIVMNKSYGHYHASIGCSVLTILKSTSGEYKYLIKTNSSKKGSSAGDKHVIPSFMFQPVSQRIDTDQKKLLDFKINIIKEFGEELLGMEELEDSETTDTLISSIINNETLKSLMIQLKNKEARLIPTGLYLDVFRLRPEFTFVLIVNDISLSGKIKTNWETEKNSLDLVNLYDTDSYNELITDEKYPLCSPGAAALINGRSAAINILNKT